MRLRVGTSSSTCTGNIWFNSSKCSFKLRSKSSCFWPWVVAPYLHGDYLAGDNVAVVFFAVFLLLAEAVLVVRACLNVAGSTVNSIGSNCVAYCSTGFGSFLGDVVSFGSGCRGLFLCTNFCSCTFCLHLMAASLLILNTRSLSSGTRALTDCRIQSSNSCCCKLDRLRMFSICPRCQPCSAGSCWLSRHSISLLFACSCSSS